MRGTFTFKPLKANLTHSTELILKMDPYCSFTVGTQKFKSQICKSGGKNPVWSDEIIIPIDTDQQFAYLQLMDQDRLTKDDNIGTATIDLFEVMNNSNRFVSKWYPIFYKNKSAGEILIEIAFQPGGQTFTNQPFVSGTQNIRQETLPSSGLTGKSTGYPLGTGLEQGTTGYGQGTSGYGQGTSGYGQGTSGYGQGTSGYSQGTSGLTQNIGSQTSGYGQNVPLQGTTGYKESSLGGTGSTGYGQNIGSQTSGYSQNVGGQNLPLGSQGTSGYSQGVGEIGGQNLPMGSQGTSGYSQGIGGQGLGVQGTSSRNVTSNIQSGLAGQATTLEDPLYGKTVDVQSAGERSYERSYQQGTLGQGNLGQGNLGQGNLGQGNLGQGNLNKNLNPEQFNQPGYY